MGNDLYGYYNKTTMEWNGLIDDLFQGRAHIAGVNFNYVTNP